MENDKHVKIKFYSEDAQDILGKTPSWIIRWGISIISCIFIILLVGSYYMEYPNTVQAQMILVNDYPLSHIKAKISGKIYQINIKAKQTVQPGEILAIMESSCNPGDVLALKAILYKQLNHNLKYNQWKDINLLRNSQLGTISYAYNLFLDCTNNYIYFKQSNYYNEKIAYKKEKINEYYLSILELEKRSYGENPTCKMKKIGEKIDKLKEEILDIMHEQREKEKPLLLNYQNAKRQLILEISRWENTYILSSNTEGKVFFALPLTNNTYVNSGDTLFTIIPLHNERFEGEAILETSQILNLKNGQEVIARFANYPENEYGVVKGIISSISSISDNGYYTIRISFPNGFNTTNSKELSVTLGMEAKINIITGKQRLINKLLKPLR